MLQTQKLGYDLQYSTHSLKNAAKPFRRAELWVVIIRPLDNFLCKRETIFSALSGKNSRDFSRNAVRRAFLLNSSSRAWSPEIRSTHQTVPTLQKSAHHSKRPTLTVGSIAVRAAKLHPGSRGSTIPPDIPPGSSRAIVNSECVLMFVALIDSSWLFSRT